MEKILLAHNIIKPDGSLNHNIINTDGSFNCNIINWDGSLNVNFFNCITAPNSGSMNLPIISKIIKDQQKIKVYFVNGAGYFRTMLQKVLTNIFNEKMII